MDRAMLRSDNGACGSGAVAWLPASTRTRLRVALGRPVAVLTITLVACGPPLRPYAANTGTLSCEQANDYTLRVLQSMYFKITQFDPAAIGRPGSAHGKRKATVGYQTVTVKITCDAASTTVDAREDGLFVRPDFTHNFYTAFTATAADAAQQSAAFRDMRGLKVLIEPVTGPSVKLDFDMDVTAAGILPVRITIHNVTTRRYKFDPNEVVLLRADGTRAQPLALSDAAQRLATAETKHRTASAGAVVDAAEAARRLERKLLVSHAVESKETLTGYLFYPLGQYAQARLSLEDEESEESAGFAVDMM